MLANMGLRLPSGRIPDFLTDTVLREVKNVSRLVWSGRVAAQLRDYALFCLRTDRRFYIHVREGTEVSSTVVRELEQIFGQGSKGVRWDIVQDIPNSLRIVP